MLLNYLWSVKTFEVTFFEKLRKDRCFWLLYF